MKHKWENLLAIISFTMILKVKSVSQVLLSENHSKAQPTCCSSFFFLEDLFIYVTERARDQEEEERERI